MYRLCSILITLAGGCAVTARPGSSDLAARASECLPAVDADLGRLGAGAQASSSSGPSYGHECGGEPDDRYAVAAEIDPAAQVLVASASPDDLWQGAPCDASWHVELALYGVRATGYWEVIDAQASDGCYQFPSLRFSRPALGWGAPYTRFIAAGRATRVSTSLRVTSDVPVRIAVQGN
jgi:hypothetical protein